jgi:murein L,D-transpeptidase YafK
MIVRGHILILHLVLLVTSGCSQPVHNTSTTTDSTDRVALAQQTTGVRLTTELKAWSGEVGNPIFLRAFKNEEHLELWIKKDTTKSQYSLWKTYKICYVPGELGPKRKQGDLQVPEGVYWIDVFNPKSNFHLSLRVNYPNESDRLFADAEKPGGEIYLHGGCASTGCIPIKDENIEEVYLLALAAKKNGQENIPVHIFPCRMTDGKTENLIGQNPKNRFFWENLQPIYVYFEKNRQIPEVIVLETGRYHIKE